jgi:hypothetical protein
LDPGGRKRKANGDEWVRLPSQADEQDVEKAAAGKRVPERRFQGMSMVLSLPTSRFRLVSESSTLREGAMGQMEGVRHPETRDGGVAPKRVRGWA